MPRDNLPYAIIETAFVFSDPRYLGLRPMGKLTYLTAWCRAFNQRRSTLPRYVSEPSSLARDMGADKRTVAKMLQKCIDCGLLARRTDGLITVIGVEGKSNLDWREELPLEVQTSTPPSSPTSDRTRQEIEIEIEIERTPLPPSGGLFESAEEKPKPPTPSRPASLPAEVTDEQWAAFREHRRKKRAPLTPRAEELQAVQLAKVKAAGLDPVEALDCAILTGWQAVKARRWIDEYPSAKEDGE